MASSAVATGVALVFAYLLYFVLHLLSVFGKAGLKPADVQEKAKKLYLFAIISLLSIHFVTTYAAVFAWLTLVALFAHFFTLFLVDEDKKKTLGPVVELAYMGLLLVWWIGETVAIFGINVRSI